MHDLQAVTPLWGTAPRTERHEGITIREVTDLSLASLSARRGQEGEAQRRAEGYLGFVLPGPNRHQAGERFSATWMAPEQWLIGASIPGDELLADALKDAVEASGSVTEQSDGWCCFAVEGPRCAEIFERLTAVDIGRVEGGCATRLRLEHLSCLVICQVAGSSFLVLGQRSSAGSLFYALSAAAQALS